VDRQSDVGPIEHPLGSIPVMLAQFTTLKPASRLKSHDGLKTGIAVAKGVLQDYPRNAA
jgi:hypothetical protein